MLLPVQSLWIGDRLSAMEQLAIKSFLCQEHPFHLYVYQSPAGIPEGTTVQDANEILPAANIFKISGNESYATFADYFRFKLLLERGGWWVDMDLICLKPFRFPSEYVFASEMAAGRQCITNSVIKAPAGSPVIAQAWKACQALDKSQLKWGQSGPALFSQCVEHHNLTEFVQRPSVFCPIDPPDWETVLASDVRHRFLEETCAVHLWHELWRRANRDKDARYRRQSLYERLKRAYGVTRPPRAPRWMPDPVGMLDDLYGSVMERVRTRRRH